MIVHMYVHMYGLNLVIIYTHSYINDIYYITPRVHNREALDNTHRNTMYVSQDELYTN